MSRSYRSRYVNRRNFRSRYKKRQEKSAEENTEKEVRVRHYGLPTSRFNIFDLRTFFNLPFLQPIAQGFKYATLGINKVPIGVWAFLVIVFAIGLRLLFPMGLYAWDDFDYATIAKSIKDGRYSIANYSNWFGHRLPVIMPVGWLMRIFGDQEWVLLLWPMICSILSITFMYFIAKYLFNRKAGFFAALVMAVHPFDVKLATVLLPASVYTMLLMGGVLFFILGEKIRPKHNNWFFRLPFAPSRRYKSIHQDYKILRYLLCIILWFIAGIFMSQTYYIRAYGGLILGVPALYMLIKYRVSLFYLFVVVLTALAWLACEWYIQTETGEWFFIFKFLTKQVGPDAYITENVTKHFDLYRTMMFDEKVYSAITITFVIFLPIYFWKFNRLTAGKQAAIWVPMGFFVLFWFYLEFGVTSIKHLSFLHKRERYIGLITPAYCLVIGRVLASKLPRGAIPVIVVALALLAGFWYLKAGLPPWVETGSLYLKNPN